MRAGTEREEMEAPRGTAWVTNRMAVPPTDKGDSEEASVPLCTF